MNNTKIKPCLMLRSVLAVKQGDVSIIVWTCFDAPGKDGLPPLIEN